MRLGSAADPLRCPLLLIDEVGDLQIQGEIRLEVARIAGVPFTVGQRAARFIVRKVVKPVLIYLFSWDSPGSLAHVSKRFAAIVLDANSRVPWYSIL